MLQNTGEKMIFQKEKYQDSKKCISSQEENSFQEMDLDGIFSLVSNKNEIVCLMLALKL